MRGSKVPLKVGGQSKRTCCKAEAELVRVTSQISVGIAPPYLTQVPHTHKHLLVPLTLKLLANGVRNSLFPQKHSNISCRFGGKILHAFFYCLRQWSCCFEAQPVSDLQSAPTNARSSILLRACIRHMMSRDTLLCGAIGVRAYGDTSEVSPFGWRKTAGGGLSINTGLDYWTDLFCTKNHFMAYNKIFLLVYTETLRWHPTSLAISVFWLCKLQ